jgi:hypothetical protein
MRELPERFNYAEAYLTFRCKQGCSYCINKAGDFKAREELSAKEWIDSLNKIKFNIPLTLGGGEPTIHKEFYELVNGLDAKIDLLTNASFNTDEFIEKVNPNRFTSNEKEFYHPIRVSYHAETMDRQELVSKVKKLIDKDLNAAIFGVRHPYTINDNMAMAFVCAKNGVPFYEKDFLGKVDGRTYGFYKYPEGIEGGHKTVDCRTRELLMAPNGEVFRCHRDLYGNYNPVGNIKDENFIVEDKFRICYDFGQCNPCDLKLKTNKYLKGVECQIDIK